MNPVEAPGKTSREPKEYTPRIHVNNDESLRTFASLRRSKNIANGLSHSVNDVFETTSVNQRLLYSFSPFNIDAIGPDRYFKDYD